MTQLLAHLFGDYLLQSDWMAQNKTKRSWPALVHALLYSLCFVPLCWHVTVTHALLQQMDDFFIERMWGTAATFHWKAWLVIFSTHFLIDRFQLARYVVWAKNFIGPKRDWLIKQDYKNGYWGYGYLIGDLDVSVRDIDLTHRVSNHQWINPPIAHCPTGYPSTTPTWLSTWLLIIVDNTLHLAINYAALRWL